MNETTSNRTNDAEKFDIISILNDYLHRFRRLWWVVLLTTAIGALIFYYRVTVNYSPTYVAEATVSVEIVNGEAVSNRNTAEQMGLIFPYILTSGALSDVISADLGMDSVPGSINVSSISGTNLLTITVSSWNAQYAYDVLQSVLKNYPSVSQYVVGQTELTVIDDSGVPVDTGKMSVIRGSVRRGALIGFALGLLFILFHTAAFRTVRSESELRALVNIPCLGTLPFTEFKKRRKNKNTNINILYDSSHPNYVESMRLIRTRLERQMTDKHVLMVTSSISGEGKSTVASNLAISMALKGKRVILIDCDLRNPSVGPIFNLEGSFPGLVAVLQGKCSVDDALYEVHNQGDPIGLFLLPGGDHKSNLVEILGSSAMSDLIVELRNRADIVILDTPPSAVLVDAMMLLKHVDAVAYVVMNDYARRRYIAKGIEELRAGDAPIVGCILNGGSTHSGGYGYYGYRSAKYGYGYGYGYAPAKNGSSGKSSAKKDLSESK